MNDIVLEMKNISKSFVGVKALDNVNFTVRRGEIHAICGENGAGKSTLMKILYGIYKMDTGEIWIEGKKQKITSPTEAQKAGLSIIFQEFNLVDQLSVAENIYLGRLKGTGKKIDWKKIYQDAQERLDYIGCDIDSRMIVGDLSVSQKQMVEIAKALSYDVKIIIMDEPSATLTDNEVEKLFNVIEELKKKEITTIYISHKMDEVFRMCDRITVLRDGVSINTKLTSETNREEVISTMVGRDMDNEYPAREGSLQDEVILEVKNIQRNQALEKIGFNLKKGEILGIAGLVGAGRTELVRAVFGADPVYDKELYINGEKRDINSPRDAIKNGIALVNEDRKALGLILKFSVAQNVSICKLKDITSGGLVSTKKEKKVADDYIKTLSIKTPSVNQKCVFLSGGNQQKVVLAKWLYADADILMLDEPTRGIDVGSKYEIYKLINQLADEGKSIIMISSELPEILGMSDRILVLHKGAIVGEFDNHDKQVTGEQIMNCAIG